MSRRTVLVLSIALAGCADGCGCSRFKASLATPTEEEYRREAERQLPTAADVATTICGFPVTGLEGAKVTSRGKVLSTATLAIEGTPIPGQAAKEAGGEAGVDVAVGKVLKCVAVVSLTASAILDDDSHQAKGFVFGAMAVESVETPGVSFSKEHTGGGRHRRRHHRH